jgi:ribosomal protein S4
MRKFAKYKTLLISNRKNFKRFPYRVFKFHRPKWNFLKKLKRFRFLFFKFRQSRKKIFQEKTYRFLNFNSSKLSFLRKFSFDTSLSKSKNVCISKYISCLTTLKFRCFRKKFYDKERLSTFFIQKAKLSLLKDLVFLNYNKPVHLHNDSKKNFLVNKTKNDKFFYFSKIIRNDILKKEFSSKNRLKKKRKFNINEFLLNKLLIKRKKKKVSSVNFYTTLVNKKKKKINLPFIRPYLVKNRYDFLEKIKNYYKNSNYTKILLSNTFGNSVNIKKITKKKISDLSKKKFFLNFLIKPQYRLNILLWNLYFFSTPHQANQQLLNKQILVNGKAVNSNILLRKGDIISFLRNTHCRFFKSFSKKCSPVEYFLTFIEVDYETETIIVIKDFSELSTNDLYFLMTNSFALRNLTYS